MKLGLIFIAAFLLSFSASAGGDPIVDTVMRTASRQDESSSELRKRAGTIQQAIYSSSRSSSARALVAVIWKRESSFALDVHAGGRGKYGSDNGRAKCLGQIHASRLVPLHEWEKLGGTDLKSTTLCARATLKLFESKMLYCSKAVSWEGSTVGTALQAYATGKCGPPGREALKRLSLWLRLRAELAD